MRIAENRTPMNKSGEIHQKELLELRRKIQIGIGQAERGQVCAFNKQTLEEIMSEGRARLAAERKLESR